MPLMTVKRQNFWRPTLAKRVERALRAKGYMAPRTSEVSIEGSRIVLKWRLHRYYMKQMAQGATLAVPGMQEY